MKNKKAFSIGRLIGRCALENPVLSLGLIISSLGAVAAVLIPPLVLEEIVNGLMDNKAIGLSLALLYFAMLALSGVFDALKEMLITVFGQKITRRVRHDMCAKLNRMRADYFAANEPGATASRFVGDVDTIETLFGSGVIGMAVDFLKIIGIMAVIFIKSTGLGILLLIIMPALFCFTRTVQKRMLSAQLENRATVAKMNSFVPETIKNIRMIHVFRREKYMERRYKESIDQSYRAVDKINFYDAVYSPVILIVSALIIAVMMVMAATGGAALRFFGMSVGTSVAVIAYVGKVFDPLENIGMEIQTVQSAVAGIRRVSSFMNEEEKAPVPKTSFQKNITDIPALEVENLSFSYDKETQVINDLSFCVFPGERITLAGRTGAGKSTVFKIILGLYQPETGCVRIFSQAPEAIPDGQKRKIIGYVNQSFRPMPGTVADQISAFDEKITRSDIERAAKLAGIHETVLTLPNGYDTLYSDGFFSQGQRQLLAVARAVVSDPKILLLDEITANLDSDTEHHILEALDRASEKRTVISISHRLYEQTGGKVIEI